MTAVNAMPFLVAARPAELANIWFEDRYSRSIPTAKATIKMLSWDCDFDGCYMKTGDYAMSDVQDASN